MWSHACDLTRGARYFVNFIDDKSRRSVIRFIARKSKTLARFKEFKAVSERETGKFIRILHPNNGGEYISQELCDFCAESGIKIEYTAPHT